MNSFFLLVLPVVLLTVKARPRDRLNTIRIENSLDPDEMPHSVVSHLDPNCLQRLSKFGSSTERVLIVNPFQSLFECCTITPGNQACCEKLDMLGDVAEIFQRISEGMNWESLVRTSNNRHSTGNNQDGTHNNRNGIIPPPGPYRPRQSYGNTLVVAGGVQSRRGAYDDWKTVPFVDNEEHKVLGEYDRESHSSKNVHDKYEALYKKYNQKLGRGNGDGNDLNSKKTVVTSPGKQAISKMTTPAAEIKAVEGGLEDMRRYEEKTSDSKSEKKQGRNMRKNRKSKKDKKHRSVKKELPKDSMEDGLEFNMEKFYKENPNFHINNETIIVNEDKIFQEEKPTNPTFPEQGVKATEDAAVKSELTVEIAKNTDNEKNVSENVRSNDESYDDYNQKDTIYDIQDDFDDAVKAGIDSRSRDDSSEGYDHYDLYDEGQDSSYSSSEMRAETAMDGLTPPEWFKSFDKKEQGDDPNAGILGTLLDTRTTVTEKDNIDATQVIEKVDKSPIDSIPKTDVEPSTSPNPATPAKDLKSTVTQPAYSNLDERVNTWNLIESKPIESCQDNSDCAAGRMCKFGLCLCGQPDMCAGHSKPVCGSDGRRYPSHCELHRTACVLGVHIKLDRAGTCLTEDDKKYRSVPKKTAIKVAKDDDMMQQDASTVEHILPNGNGLLAESTTVKPTSGSGANKSDKNGNTIDDNSSNVSEKIVQIPADENRVTNQVTTSKVIVDRKEYENDSLTIVGSLNKNDTLNVENNSTDPQNYDDYNNNVSTEEIDSDDLQDIYNENMESKSELKDDYDDDYKDVSVSIDDTVEAVTDKPSLVPLYCTPDLYVRFKADILQYHCIYFKEEHCDGQTQQEKQRLAAIMFNYYDKDFSSYIDKEELWAMQLLERMDELSSLCTLLDIVLFDELGPKDGKLSADEFIQAFDIPDVLEHKTVVVPLLATVGNGLEVKCDVANTKDVIWKRNSVDLATVDFPGITVLGDGSLYIETVGFHVVGNLTCHDRRKPSVKQIHMLTVHKPPHVQLLTKSLHIPDGVDLVIQCHVEGYPRPSVTWHAHDRPLENGPKYHIQSYDDTLTVHNVNYAIDSGVYTCQVKNTAGMAEGMVTITVNAPNDTKPSDVPPVEESFLIFHDDGYTLKEPSQCLTQRHVKPDFGNFFFLPDELDAPPSLCEPGIPCVWGGAVNVKGMFVYVTQPRQNRVVVIDVKETLNPNQVISTDKMPVSLHYMEHLDEVWVLCWNGEENGGSKTIVIIRNASQKIQHHVVHTQPIGNRYDQVQDVFLPPSSELNHPYRYGYTVHRGQEGMFKVDLDLQKYAKAVDLTKFECVPFAVAFVPLGGNIIVQCVKENSYNRITSLLTLDMITDTVLNNMTSEAVVYVSPDVGNVVFVDEASGNIAVHQVSENGEITHQFDVTLGTQVGKATFHKANYYHGYDLYLTGKVKEVVFSVGLDNGKIESFTDIGTPEQEMLLPWLSHDRPLISGDIFSDYLATTADSSMLVLDSVRHEIKCHVQELQHPSLIVHTHLNEH